eukprot:scaffold30909_cov63-Phaeocystis_antarctica.AAC.4
MASLTDTCALFSWLYFFMVAPPPRRRRGLAQRNGVNAGWFVNSPRTTTSAFLDDETLLPNCLIVTERQCELRDDTPTVARATTRSSMIRQRFSRRVRRYPVSFGRRTLRQSAHPPRAPTTNPDNTRANRDREAPPRVTLTTRRHCCMRRCTGAQERPFCARRPPSLPCRRQRSSRHPSASAAARCRRGLARSVG